MKMTFKITNITCGACVKLSELSLKKIPGVKKVEIESSGAAMIESDREITKEEIAGALAKTDKTASFS